ncbi:S8 family serine peptidase [Clostridium sp. 19966]|uniref:S8 family serine peptidase n=1 Tax=Clostridium sp. 19966 TaxID=2768166 RepID=UPI0028DEF8CE|nr:S8 family serine peptidase [Clostridium sp. 19966]MDT8717445.1 S8 family serine peptidase [Clostridium sp. 19966]
MKKAKLKLLSVVTALALVSSLGISVKADSKSFSADQLKSILAESYKSSLKENSKLGESLKAKLGIKDSSNDGEVKNTTSKTDENQLTRIIVQLSDSPAINTTSSKDKAKANEASVKNSQKDVISQVEKITGVKVKRSFGYLVNGFSIDAKLKDVNKIAALKGVKKVFEANVYKPDMYYAKQITGATSVWNQDKYKGEGMVVAIIDTGIDYTHKDLKITDASKDKLNKTSVDAATSKLNHGKFYTDKVPYAYNYADNNDNVIDTTGEMHGMHVAGIVAANGADDPNFKSVAGVAPEAQLLDMKVFSNNPHNSDSAYDDDIIAAIEDSVKLGADVINMSLGSSSGFNDADSPEQIAVNNATDAGVIVCVAAGNDGESTNTNSWNQPENLLGTKDTSTVGSPGTTPSALTVASMENTNLVGKALSVNIGSQTTSMVYADVQGDDYSSLKTPHDLVYCNLGNPDDFTGKDLSGKIALIKRGAIAFTDKVTNAEKAGAAGVIIFNNDGKNDFIQMSVTNYDIPALSVGNNDGDTLVKNISSVKVSIDGSLMGVENVDKDDMSQYTSWGPTESLDFKPEITAPGGDIYSLANNNGYQSMSGTSMATPNTSGSEALVIQSIKARNIGLTGKDAVEFAKRTIMNTATVMNDKYNSHVPYSPRRQGAGLINLPSAVTNNVIITDSTGNAGVALKSFSETTKSFDLTLKNYGGRDVTYTLPAAKLLSEYNTEDGAIYEDAVNGGQVSFDKSSVTVPAGGTAKVTVTINIPSDTSKFATDNFVEGFVSFDSSTNSAPSLSVPFMGFYGDWAALNIVDKPADDSQSTTGATWLGTLTDAGFSFIDTADYDPDKLGFSPNDDGLQDLVAPNLYMLRNAKNVTVQILDKNKIVLSNLYTQSNVSKTSLEDFVGGKTNGTTLSNAKWDGTIYDAATGEYKAASEGQYYYRILATADYPGAQAQTTDIPVKIDNTAPTETISSAVANTDGTYHIQWTASDTGTGIYSQLILLYVNNQLVLVNKGVSTDASVVKNFKQTGNNFSADITVNPESRNNVAIAMLDNAENISVASKEFEVGTVPKVEISNLQDGQFVSKNDLDPSGYYDVFGEVSSDVASLTLNDVTAEINSGVFDAALSLKEGKNAITAIGKDSSGKTIYNSSYTVTLDTSAPALTISTAGYTDDNSIIKSDADFIDITGNVKDDNLATLLVNDDEANIDTNGNFKVNVALLNGLNTIAVQAIDKAGNTTVKDINVLYTNPNGAFTVNFDNLAGFQTLTEKDTKDDVYTIKGSVNHAIKNFTINGAAVNVKSDNTFAVDVKLNQGTNVIKLYAEDNGVVYYNYGYKILYDSKAPILALTSPVARADGKIYTKLGTVNLIGKVTDNLYGYSLYLNGNMVLNYDKYPSNDSTALTKDFNIPVNVKDGDYITLSAIDEFGNTAEDKVQVVVDNTAPAAPQIIPSTTVPTNKAVNISFSDSDKDIDYYEYSFDGSHFFKYEGKLSTDKNTDVYAIAVDYAGNTSNISNMKIDNIDTVAPDVKVSGVADKGIYTSAVTPAITSTDPTATVVATLNGAPYTSGIPINTVGDYTLSAYTVDKAGNQSPTETLKFTLAFAANTVSKAGTSTIVVDDSDLQSTSSVLSYTVSNADNIGVELPYSILNASNKALALNGDRVGISLPTSVFAKKAGSKISLTATLNTATSTSGLKIAGKVYDFNLYQTDSAGTATHITSFNGAVATIVMKLSADDIKGLDASRLAAYYYNEATKAWELVGGAFDANTSTLTFTTPHFSTYVVAEKPKTTSTTGDSGSGTSGSGSDSSSSNSSTSSSKPTKLVQTGYFLDSTVLSGIGIVFIVSGAAIIIFRRKRTE